MIMGKAISLQAIHRCWMENICDQCASQLEKPEAILDPQKSNQTFGVSLHEAKPRGAKLIGVRGEK
jgi:hypothetical protein